LCLTKKPYLCLGMRNVYTPKPGQTAQALVGTVLLSVALTLGISMKVGMESTGKASWPALTPTHLRLRLAGLEGSPKPLISSSRALLPEEKQKFQAATGGPAFIENKGQWHPDVLYLCRLGGLDAWITKWGVNYTFFKLEEKPSAEAREPFLGEKFGRREVELIGHRVLMKLRGCAAHPQREGREMLAGYYNYLIGNDPTRHATYVRRYKEAWVKGVYAGIDMRYYLEGGRLRYDWVVQPGGDPSQIVFGLEGSEKTYIDSEGRLVFTTRFGEVKLAELRVYQGDREIGGRFVERPGGWGIEVGSYDPTQLLVIDPLVYSTYIGGGGFEEGYAIAVDGSGNAYVTGVTGSFNYDVTPGAFQTTFGGYWDVFVTKLNATGTALVYSTYIGGSDGEEGYGIAVDGSGTAYVTGRTFSTDYDVTPGAFQTTNGGGWDVFVTKLNATGTALVYSTYIGGSGGDEGYGIAVDGSGYAYVTGYTNSPDYDVTTGAFQTTNGGGQDVFVTKLNATGTALVYSTYIGGSDYDEGYAIAVDGSGNAYVTGFTFSTDYDVTPGAFQTTKGDYYYKDVFVTKLNATGTALVYSTYIGGRGDDHGNAIAVDGSGNAYVTGFTSSTDYDVTPGAFQTTNGGIRDVFVTKLNATGTALVYSTYIGGSDNEGGSGIAVDGSGNAYVTGATLSTDYDVTPGSFQMTHGGGVVDVFVTKLNATGTALVYSTYIGGSDNEGGYGIAVDGSGNAYVTGATLSTDYDVTPGAFQTTNGGSSDVFVTKVCHPITLTSAPGTDNQTVCVNTPITPITYSTTGATGATFSGLPAGVTGTFSGGNITISGTPTVTGTFNYTVTLTGGCGNVTATGTIIVQLNNTNNTITLTSAPGTDNQTVCVNTAITPITYSTTGATGATFSGLPAGVTGTFSGSNITISGTPTVAGTFNYTVTLTGGCGNVTAAGTIIVQPNNTITLTSAPGTDNQTVCVNTAITPITYSTTGATGATFSGLPAGVTGTFSGGNITISGTPTVTGTFTYTVTLTGGCGNVTATGTIIVQPNITLTSAPGTDIQIVCVYTPITPITYSTTGATGATFSGLPPGVTGTFSGGNITISGTPTVAGTFNYTVTVTGGCGGVTTAIGIIIVQFNNNNTNNTITLTSAPGTDNQTVCVNTAITPITYSTTGATGATFSGLPTGVTGTFSGGNITISGTPTVAGTFNYTVTLTGGCGNVTSTGTIIVRPNNTITLTSAPGTDNQTVCVNTAITPITYSTTGVTGATFSGLPAGVTGTLSGGYITISGTPTVTGTFNYTVTLTGGCGGVTTATGTIIVQLNNTNNTITLTSAPGTDNQTVCVDTAITPITYSTTGATGATFSGLPTGVTGTFSGGYITISGTPTVAGTFNYTVTLTGGCGNITATGTIIVRPNNTITLTSAPGTNNQTVCVNTAIIPITYSTTGATGATFSGLPAGVTGTFSGGNITISGTPTVAGTFNYMVTLTGGCGNVTATGTIIVQPNITLTSAPGTDNQTVCVNTPLTPITYSTTGATGATFSDLPPGVTGTFSGGDITISGTPTVAGTFNYTVTLTGGCGNVTATGTIIVRPNNTITLTSAPGTDNQTVCVNTAITPITYSTTGATGATFSGLPPGVTGTFSGGNITISGTPTVAGTFTYTVTLTGGCGNVTATGMLVVNACQPGSLLGGGGGGPRWRVYPNPTSGSFTIESSEDGTFELINGHGQVVQVYEVRRGRAELQATLSAGVYYLREQRSGTVQKVVILE
jgi:hypothetical protein